MASASVNSSFSDYYSTLDGPSRERYQQKVNLVGFDPYALKKSDFSDDLDLIPAVEYPDIVNYLILQTSWATNAQMKAYKSMEAYNFFISGWVSTLLMHKAAEPDKVDVFARVNHSQRARDTPLKSWIFAEKTGRIITAHCDCMAGLSEACSHVAAIMFAAEVASRMHHSTTCTQEKSKWLIPGHEKEIPYVPVEDIDFTSAKKKHDLLVNKDVVPTPLRTDARVPTNNRTSLEDQVKFFQNISLSDSKPAILSLIPPYNLKYIPKETVLPKPITNLYDEENMNLSHSELLEKCSKVTLTISDEEIKAIEAHTRQQSATSVWFQQRGGRITASNFKSASHTNINKPSQSLIKTICYPGAMKFKSTATTWGCNNESNARGAYLEHMRKSHEYFTISDSGLQVNKQWPFIGASPDGMVYCKCCGSGVCEVKCPYKAKDAHPTDLSNENNYCLKQSGNLVYLDKAHSYYYQVQCQMFVCDVEYCDFIVWTPKGLFVERIMPDVELWNSALAKATDFFFKGILPEIVGKWYSRPTLPSTHVQPDVDDDDAEWCICQRRIEGSTLVGCDNDDCKIKWYHLQCLRLKEPPQGSWLCNNCQL